MHQAHLPGNFELYDPDSNEQGAALCKSCWEEGGVRNASSLETAWMMTEGKEAIFWLCHGHLEDMRSESRESRRFIRSATGVVRYPPLRTTMGGSR